MRDRSRGVGLPRRFAGNAAPPRVRTSSCDAKSDSSERRGEVVNSFVDGERRRYGEQARRLCRLYSVEAGSTLGSRRSSCRSNERVIADRPYPVGARDLVERSVRPRRRGTPRDRPFGISAVWHRGKPFSFAACIIRRSSFRGGPSSTKPNGVRPVPVHALRTTGRCVSGRASRDPIRRDPTDREPSHRSRSSVVSTSSLRRWAPSFTAAANFSPEIVPSKLASSASRARTRPKPSIS